MARLFQNQFLDSLMISSSPNQIAKDLRILGTGLSVEELSKILGIAKRTIYGYESEKNPNKIPKQYFILLRFLSGDLSYFQGWENCTIQPSSNRLKVSVDKYNTYTPNSLYGRSYELKHYLNQQAERKTKQAIEPLEKEILFLNHLLKKYRQNEEIQSKKDNVIHVNFNVR